MKIDSPSLQATTLRSTPPNAAKPASTPAPAMDEVSLSALSQVALGGEKPPVNSARVQEIKDAIAQGRFRINPEAIADGLIETARDLVNSQRKA